MNFQTTVPCRFIVLPNPCAFPISSLVLCLPLLSLALSFQFNSFFFKLIFLLYFFFLCLALCLSFPIVFCLCILPLATVAHANGSFFIRVIKIRINPQRIKQTWLPLRMRFSCHLA